MVIINDTIGQVPVMVAIDACSLNRLYYIVYISYDLVTSTVYWNAHCSYNE